MTTLLDAVAQVREAQGKTKKPLSIVLAGHNGSGKSTMWESDLSGVLEMPLINADRLMRSILPDVGQGGFLPKWADDLQNTDPGWLRVAQQGVQSFVAHAIAAKRPFAMETVFSEERPLEDGRVASKIDLIAEMQAQGYFVLLIFVGLTSAELSVARVATRVSTGGHGIPEDRLKDRFPRTQRMIRQAALVADATIMTDNSRDLSKAFTVTRVQLREKQLYDMRAGATTVPSIITTWLDVVAPGWSA